MCGYWLAPAVVVLLRAPGHEAVAFLVLERAGGLIPQLFALPFGCLVAGAARAARLEVDAHIEVLTDEKIAEAIQANHVHRYADVMANVVPLLQALSRREPVTSDMLRRARAESRRLRTLFDLFRADHPLLFEMQALAECAEDRGVEVMLHFDGEVPELDGGNADVLVRATAGLVDLATTSARIVVTAADAGVTISVVCEVAQHDAGRRIDDCVELVWSGRTAWTTIRHPLVHDGSPEGQSGRDRSRS